MEQDKFTIQRLVEELELCNEDGTPCIDGSAVALGVLLIQAKSTLEVALEIASRFGQGKVPDVQEKIQAAITAIKGTHWL